jgi:hypothetical protein
MNWKIATLGLGSVMVLLAAFSLSNTVMGFTGGTIHVSIPQAQLQGVKMYGGSYDDPVPVVVQEVDSLNCPAGQIITREMTLPGPITIKVKLSMGKADLSKVLMKATGLQSTSGTLENVDMWVENVPQGLVQTIKRGTMYNLDTDIYFVSMSSLGYENLKIELIYP